jgi:tRNA pseudouridine55 synthase
VSAVRSTYHGVIPLYKTGGMTSHDAVDEVRRIMRVRTVGHAGTLDPAAEGLLVILLGKATKVARFLSGKSKRYEAEVTLGRVSTTYDAEGVDITVPAAVIPSLTRIQLQGVLDKFRGVISQQVPAFSAVRVGGERLYEKARKGEAAERPVREVTIHELRLMSFEGDKLKFEVECSSGTYVRSLAHDIGQALGCGAYLSHLKRTACGSLRLDDAATLEELASAVRGGSLEDILLPIDKALGFCAVTIREEFRRRILDGRSPRAGDILRRTGEFVPGDHLVVMDPAGAVLAVAVAEVSSSQIENGAAAEVLKYDRVLA